jgi:hypothetical protein
MGQTLRLASTYHQSKRKSFIELFSVLKGQNYLGEIHSTFKTNFFGLFEMQKMTILGLQRKAADVMPAFSRYGVFMENN